MKIQLDFALVDRVQVAAFERLESSLQRFQAALAERQVPADSLRLGSIRLQAETEYHDGKHHHIGFRASSKCNMSMRLARNHMMALLTLSSQGFPELAVAITYTLEHPERALEQLLRAAVVDAATKASVLASASGVRLGEVESINFGESELAFKSHPRPWDAGVADRADSMDGMPDEDEIEQDETVSMTWGIVN